MWQEALKVVFAADDANNQKQNMKNYKVHVHLETLAAVGKPAASKSLWNSTAASVARVPGRILSFWCFSAGVTMRQLAVQGKCRSIILASGTLSPLDSFAAELQMYIILTIYLSYLLLSFIVPSSGDWRILT